MKNICFAFLLGLVLFSCKDPYENNLYLAYNEQPLATYLKSNPDSFSMWVSVIEKAGLFNTLNLSNTYTCFVPNNSAVKEYLKGKNLTSVDGLSVEDAAILVKYHTLQSIAFKQNMFTNGVITYPTISDDYLSVEFREGGFKSIYINGLAKITNLDVEVTNGVIHVIDKVLIPITETIGDKLGTDRYTIFNQAVVATGFQDSLKTVSKVILDNTGSSVTKKYKYTLFAVPDSIFKLQGITTLDGLMTKLGVSGTDYTSAGNALNKYVSYHLLSQTKSYTDLSNFPDNATSMNMNTLASKELISLTNVLGVLYVNYDASSSKGIKFVKSDINCKNGVIHEVNDWMPLFTPPRVKVIWDLTDYSDLASVCTSYQSAALSSAYTKEITDGMVSCYKWKSMPESKTGVVFYRNNKSTENPWFSATNHDHLRLVLGMSGWLEMKTPVLIKGKYKITLSYISGFYATNTGIMLCSMDGSQLGGQLTISNTSKDQIKTATLSASYEFTETTDHTFRILSIDGKLLTLDYISFEPVN